MPKKLIKSFSYAGAGAKYALQTQRNLLIHFIIGLTVISFAAWAKVGLIELAILVLAVFGVIVMELINTAIEELVNILSPERRKEAALAKNVAAAAVLLAAVGVVIISVIIFISRWL